MAATPCTCRAISWKKVSFPYTVTEHTVIEFDFKSTAQGEVHGIGFDNNESMSDGYTYKLHGTQSWGINIAFYKYAASAPNYRHYRIPVGEQFTGNMLYIVFVNDHDISNPTGQSYFSNIRVFEDSQTPASPPVSVDFNNYTISPLDSPALTMTIEDGGDTLHMQGNGWLKMFLPYNVSASTVIEFDYKSSAQGQVQGVLFNDTGAKNEGRTFNLYGSQTYASNAFRYDSYASGWKHFRIAVGKYYTGSMNYIIFANDQDISNPTAEGYFRNLSIYEWEVSPPLTVDFDQYALSPYSSPLGGSNPPTISIEDNGGTLHLTGNGWTQMSMPILVSQNTVLEFDFKSTAQGEIHGIGFDSDQSAPVVGSGFTFKLYGTQNYGLTAFNDYAASAPGWKHYSIPVGQYYTGQMLYLFFANDHDITNPTAESYFSNVYIFTLAPTPTSTPWFFTPTVTFTPSSTPTLTQTLTPTFTSTNSPTLTPSTTPTSTSTATPTPNQQGSGMCWESGPSWPVYTVTYDIDASTIPSDWESSIYLAAQTWNNVTPSHFSFFRQSGSSNTVRYEIPDNPQWLAAATHLPGSGPYELAYIQINPNYQWDYHIPPAAGMYNVQNVVTHEFGHWLSLNDIYHPYCSEVTMYHSVDPNGEIKKIDLEIPDINGINYQYP